MSFLKQTLASSYILIITSTNLNDNPNFINDTFNILKSKSLIISPEISETGPSRNTGNLLNEYIRL